MHQNVSWLRVLWDRCVPVVNSGFRVEPHCYHIDLFLVESGTGWGIYGLKPRDIAVQRQIPRLVPQR